MRRNLFVAVFLLLCSGFSAVAQEVFQMVLGERGIHTVSEATGFVTGKITDWTAKGVTVINPKTDRIYKKTRWQMRHLPIGTVVNISAALVPMRRQNFAKARSISTICSGMSVWRCTDRLQYFNGNSAVDQKLVSMTMPEYFPQ